MAYAVLSLFTEHTETIVILDKCLKNDIIN